MRVAVLTPLPPVRSGIAGYARLLLPHLAKRAELTAVVDQRSVEPVDGVEIVDLATFRARRDSFDAVIGQLGNNPYHDFIFEEALARPMHLVLHDAVLHHLIVERTLARGDVEAYEELALDSDGPAAAAFARGRAAGLHLELGNFLFPLAAGLARRARGVIVHNRWAGERLRDRGVEAPIVVAGHPYDDRIAPPGAAERDATRASLGFAPEHRVIGMFGFVTGAKRPEAVFEAFGRAAGIDPELRLLVVGEPAPNVDLEAMAEEAGIPRPLWRATAWVADADFDRYLAAADRVVNLRYPSAGEMSGPLIRALQFGIPVAVSENGQFAELPRDAVAQIPLTEEEIPALVSFMTRPIAPEIAREAQRRWLESHGAIDRVVEAYLRSLAGGDDLPAARREAIAGLPFLPALAIAELDAWQEGAEVAIRFGVRNGGESACRAAAFGEPALRLVVKLLDGETVIADRWVAPASDLAPGDAWEGTLRLPGRPRDGSVTVTAALSETPDIDREPLAAASIRPEV